MGRFAHNFSVISRRVAASDGESVALFSESAINTVAMKSLRVVLRETPLAWRVFTDSLD